MKISLSHLPEGKQQDLHRVTQLIVETVSPEKIILFGSYATGTWVEDRYTEGHITYEYISDYDILVVTKAGEKKKDYEITDQIENRLRFRTPVNVITHDIEYVNKQLEEGQYFFTDIVKEGVMLYDAGNISLEHRRELNLVEIKQKAERDFKKWFDSANEFLIDAQNAFNRNSHKKAAFELHQAAERLYNAVILVYTGYKPKTHNLDKLRGLTKRFSKVLFNVFPQNTIEEKYLFTLLQKGYIDARYNDNYFITKDELNTLIEKVKDLQNTTARICEDKILSIGV